MFFGMRVQVACLAAAAIALLTLPAAAKPWSRGFVVGEYGYAFHYGGMPKAKETDPGADCARGSTVHFVDKVQMRKALEQQPWRSKQEIDYILSPPGIEKARVPAYVRFYIWGRAASYRGFRKGIETYVNPFAAPDPGEPEVTGKISDGLDLDNNPKTGGFVSPEGQRGIDNALYRAWGCDAPFRGPMMGTLDLRANTQMLEGLFTIVIRLSGNQDPMNDDNATLEIGFSPDKIVKNAKGEVATDYSYRIAKTEQYTKLKATIKDGVVMTEQVGELHMPRFGWFYDQMGDADFHKGRIRLVMDAKGDASGVVGGYRDWRDIYAENTFAQTGAEQGVRDHEDAISLYYALKRNADGMQDAKTGQYLGISSAYRMKAVPAYVVDPAKPAVVTVVAEQEKGRTGRLMMQATFIRAISTRKLQAVPLGTGEGQFPRMEKTIADLPSKEFFLTHLDAPARLDADGKVIPNSEIDPNQPLAEQAASNTPSTAVADAKP